MIQSARVLIFSASVPGPGLSSEKQVMEQAASAVDVRCGCIITANCIINIQIVINIEFTKGDLAVS